VIQEGLHAAENLVITVAVDPLLVYMVGRRGING
jgi:hypothetical protein